MVNKRQKKGKPSWQKGYEAMLERIGYTQEVEDTIADRRAGQGCRYH